MFSVRIEDGYGHQKDNWATFHNHLAWYSYFYNPFGTIY